MASPITRIVEATVTKTSASISRQGFGTGLGTHQVDLLVQPTRFQTYTSLQEMLNAGFTALDSAFQWASTLLSQPSHPSTFAIGRRIPGVKKNITMQITAPEVGQWLVAVTDPATSYTQSYSFIASALDTPTSIAEGFRLQVEQDQTAIVTVPTVAQTTDTLDIFAGVAGTDFTWVTTPPGAGTATDTVVTGNTPPEDITDALNAIELENDNFYIFNIDTRTDGDITAAATWAAARLNTKVFVTQTSDPDMRTNTVPNIGSVLGSNNYDNVYLIWKEGALNYEDAAATAIGSAADLDAENGAITWANKQYVGVGFTNIPQGDINNIILNNGNVHLEIAGRGNTEPGKAVSGEFMDIQTTIDWAKARVQEAVFGAISTSPTKVPGTNAGIAQVTAPFLGVLKQGVIIGHFSGDDPEFPRVRAPLASERTLADRQDRILRDVIGEALFSGAIHNVLLQLNLSF